MTTTQAPALSDLRDTVVIITGTNRGLGRALAEAFGAEGARLVVHARAEVAAAESARRVLALGAGAATPVSGELLDPELGPRIASAAEALGGAGLLILSAGMLGPMKPLLQTSPEVFSEVMRTNVDAQVALASAVVPPMIARGRGIVLWLSSGLGRFGLPDYGAYCASKHGLEGAAKVLALEHADDGILSVPIAPGMVQTEMLKAALGTDDVSAHQDPGETARAFVRMVRELGPEHSGQPQDIATWLQPGGVQS